MVHLLNLNPFSKESQEIEVELIVVAPSVSSSSESLEFFVMVHKVTYSVFSFIECLEFFFEFL